MSEGQGYLFAAPIRHVSIAGLKCGTVFGQGDIHLATVFRIVHAVGDTLGFRRAGRRDTGPVSLRSVGNMH